MVIKQICELVLPDKSNKELLLFKKYKHWLYADWEIPEQVIKNYIHDLETLKLKEK